MYKKEDRQDTKNEECLQEDSFPAPCRAIRAAIRYNAKEAITNPSPGFSCMNYGAARLEISSH